MEVTPVLHASRVNSTCFPSDTESVHPCANLNRTSMKSFRVTLRSHSSTHLWVGVVCVCLCLTSLNAQESNDFYLEPDAQTALATTSVLIDDSMVANSFLVKPVAATVPASKKARFSRIRIPFLQNQQRVHEPHAKQKSKDIPQGRLYVRGTLEQKLQHCIDLYKSRPESVDEHSSWGCLHAALSFEKESTVVTRGRTVNAMNWLLNNGACRGKRLMYTKDDKLHVKLGPGFQGHEGQLLAILAQSGVGPREKVRVDGKDFQVTDIIKQEMDSCRPATELTFKLIGLSYYLDTTKTWKSDDGEDWDVARLIAEEIKQPINGVACGGSHRLMGLSFAVKRRRIQGQPVDGQYARADKYIRDYVKYTMSLQNPDGSFSTQWFEHRQFRDDIDRKLQTTGHMLEWLAYTLDDSSLQDPRVVRAVNYLTSLMIVHVRHDWQVGPRGHALRGLDLYNRRVFVKKDEPEKEQELVENKVETKATPVSVKMQKLVEKSPKRISDVIEKAMEESQQ